MKFFRKIYNYVGYYGPFASFYYLFKTVFLYCRRIFTLTGYAVKKINKRYKMRLDLKDNGISKALYLYGTREDDQVFIVSDALKSGMRVLDIGANIGYYVLLEADIVGDGGRVFAFEPSPDNFRMLEANVKMNNFVDRVTLSPMGLSDRDATMEFFVSSRSNLHTLNPEDFKPRAKQPPFTGSIRIDVRDIAKFLQKQEIDFIRMDIEGHEVEVLNSLAKGIFGIKRPPSILLETHLSKYDDKDHSMRSAMLNLYGHGYAIDKIISNNEPKSPLRQMGYNPERIIRADQMHRGVYRNVNMADALRCICDTGGIRAIFLVKDRC